MNAAFLASPYSQLKFWKTHPNSFERILGIVDTKMEDCKKNISILPHVTSAYENVLYIILTIMDIKDTTLD